MDSYSSSKKILKSSNDDEHDPEHPLQYMWSFCYKSKTRYNKNQSETDWLQSFQHVYDIDTIEKFWRVYNNIKNWTDLEYGCIYSYFKQGISPSWEDPQNRTGSSLQLYTNKEFITEIDLRDIYLNSLLLLVGNYLDCVGHINGCTFDKKFHGSKITFWIDIPLVKAMDIIKEISDELKINSYNETDTKIFKSEIDHSSELFKLESQPSKKNDYGRRPQFENNNSSYNKSYGKTLYNKSSDKTY